MTGGSGKALPPKLAEVRGRLIAHLGLDSYDRLPGNVGSARGLAGDLRQALESNDEFLLDIFRAWDARYPAHSPYKAEASLVAGGLWEAGWLLAQLQYDQELKRERDTNARGPKGHPLCNLALTARCLASDSLARHYALLSTIADVMQEKVSPDLVHGGLAPTLLERHYPRREVEAIREEVRRRVATEARPLYPEAFLAARWFAGARSEHPIERASVLEGQAKPFTLVLLDWALAPSAKKDELTARGTCFEAAAGLALSQTPGFEVKYAARGLDEQVDLLVAYERQPPLGHLDLPGSYGLVESKSSADPVSAADLRNFGAKCIFHRASFGILVARAGTTGSNRPMAKFGDATAAELTRRRFMIDGLTLLVIDESHLRDSIWDVRGLQVPLKNDLERVRFGEPG